MAVNIEKLIDALIESRGMTIADLTAQLGYHSKTSLVRIMKGQVNQRAVDAFAKRVQSYLALSAQEERQLSEVMEYLRWQKDYEASREMLRFLRGEQTPQAHVWLEEISTQGRVRLADRYAGKQEIRITLLNSQYMPIFHQLHGLVRSGATLEHYIHMREDPARVIHAINELIPLIYERGYSGYSYRVGERADGVQGLMDADLMVVQYSSEDGARHEDVVVFDREDHGYVYTRNQHHGIARILGIRPERYAPIKNVYFQSGELVSYIQFCEYYARLECNRSVYTIKPDVCMAWIPEDVIISALLEGEAGGIEDTDGLLEKFRRVHRDRVQNTYEKRRVAKTIMKRSAMVRFARTGMLSDHFWGMRAFTPEERVRILSLIMEQIESNPYFNVFFLKDNDYLRDAEIAWYDGVGIMAMEAKTDYALEGNHSEVMIVHDEFMRMFKEYIERALLADQVLTVGETMSFLSGLIQIALSEN